MNRLPLVLLAFATLTGAAWAHPVLKENHDRTVVVRLTPTGVRIAYRMEVDLFTATVDLHKARHPRSGKIAQDEVPAVYTPFLAGELPHMLALSLNGSPLTFRVRSQSHRLTDHLRCDYQLEASWPEGTIGPGFLVVRDGAWEDDESSKVALYLDVATGVDLLWAEVPDADLIARKAADWQPGDRQQRRHLRAVFSEHESIPPGRYRASLPPEPAPEKPDGVNGRVVHQPLQMAVAESRAEPGWAVAKGEEIVPILPEETAEVAVQDPTSLRHLLLNSNLGFGTLLFLAALFGAAHALTPGHGKTMVAAYLVGERGTLGHAVLLGIVTTLTHTAAVLILAAILPWLIGREQNVQTALEFLGGLLIAIMGLFLLLRRLLGQSDHVHLFGDHSHGPVPEGTTVRWFDLIVLGIAGGIVPCWDAIAMLAASIVLGQLWLAFPLLLAFSAGLAFVLVAIGMGVVLARKVARPHLERHRDHLELVGKYLPLLTATLITLLGLWLCWEALHGTHPRSH